MGILQVLEVLPANVISAVVYGVLIAPLIIAAYYFVQYFRNR